MVGSACAERYVQSGGGRPELAPPCQARKEGDGGDGHQGQTELRLAFDERHSAGDVEQDGIDDEESVQVHGPIVKDRRARIDYLAGNRPHVWGPLASS